MTEKQIEAEIVRKVEKLRANAPSVSEVSKRYFAAKRAYTIAVTDRHYGGVILTHYAEKEACKRYAREMNMNLEE